MPRTCDELCRLEALSLAPYAVHVSDIRGRRHPEPTHPFRTPFQRDRDRILHSRAFRHLEYKTQVFLSGSGDDLRNRLTHTIEVAGIARTLARTLGANEDLTETIALAHDLGHAPFGHAGERALHNLMKEHGGFDHNLHALRIVDVLEIKYPDFDGLNLTWEVRSGLLKHRSDAAAATLDGEPLPPGLSIEAQIADLADDLAYYGHDVDDGLESGILTEESLAGVAIWNVAVDEAKSLGLSPGTPRFRSYSVRALINAMVGDAIRTSGEAVRAANPPSSSFIQENDLRLVRFSPEYEEMTRQLRAFLFENLYFSQEVGKLNKLSADRLEFLFQRFLERPDLLPQEYAARAERDGLHRSVADWIAGMTDDFAVCEWHRLR